MQTYDTDRFLGEVQELLRLAGLDPAPPTGSDRRQADAAASALLRSFGITPVMDQVAALTRASDLPAWSERDG